MGRCATGSIFEGWGTAGASPIYSFLGVPYFLAAPCAFLCGIVPGIRPRVFPPIKANLRYRFCYHYFKSHSSLLRSSLRILEKVALDLADSRATGFSEDSTKTVFRFRLQHVALCCIGVTPGGGRVQESKNGRAKLDANLAGLGGAQNQRWHSATPAHENIQFSNNVGTRASYEDGPEIPCSQFPKQ